VFANTVKLIEFPWQIAFEPALRKKNQSLSLQPEEKDIGGVWHVLRMCGRVTLPSGGEVAVSHVFPMQFFVG